MQKPSVELSSALLKQDRHRTPAAGAGGGVASPEPARVRFAAQSEEEPHGPPPVLDAISRTSSRQIDVDRWIGAVKQLVSREQFWEMEPSSGEELAFFDTTDENLSRMFALYDEDHDGEARTADRS